MDIEGQLPMQRFQDGIANPFQDLSRTLDNIRNQTKFVSPLPPDVLSKRLNLGVDFSRLERVLSMKLALPFSRQTGLAEPTIGRSRGRSRRGRPSMAEYHEHHNPRIFELYAAGWSEWAIAKQILNEIQPPKGMSVVTNDKTLAVTHGLLYHTGQNPVDALYRHTQKICSSDQ